MCDKEFSPLDPSSFSRPDLVKVTNVHVDLELHFDTTSVSGTVDLSVEKVDSHATELILDSQDLTIDSIIETNLKESLTYTLCKPVGEFGSKLVINLPTSKATNTYQIKIQYKTSSEAKGLQWLKPEQTSTKKLAYLFSQFEAITCRSFIPLQDTPGVKNSYTANITAPSEYTVLMSAISTGSRDLGNGKSVYSFEQKIPIPSYLIAIVAGALKSRDISDRIRVWSEEGIVDKAYEEFKDTEIKLKTAEEICGPYIWGRYDLLILPPSFPFGGMENPCLTFVTPTLLAGDGSLTNVVAHEIAHSWTGNLVTNKNFEHFWLNEGFTVYIERRIIARLEGTAAQDLAAVGGLEELKETINEQYGPTNPLTCLVPKLKGVHPDDSFSKVPYEKGSLFLRYLESIVGGPEVFEVFLRKYFDNYKFKSLDTDEFKAFFENYFKDVAGIKSIDWDSWLNKPGVPEYVPNFDLSLLKTINALKAKILNDTANCSKEDLAPLSSTQKIILLQMLTDNKLSKEQVEKIGEIFDASKLKNSEMLFSWYRICLKAGVQEVVGDVLNWINEVGRMKFVRPLYRDLYHFEAVRGKAIENFKKNRKFMMHVTAYTVEHDLKLKS